MARRNDKKDNRLGAIVALLVISAIVFCIIMTFDGGKVSLPQEFKEFIGNITGAVAEEAPTIPSQLEDVTTQVHIIDVGQGESILIKTKESTVLIDSGEIGQDKTVLAYLKSLQINRIDILIATHPHSDHIGSMDKIVEEIEIGRVIMPEIPGEMIPTTRCFERLLLAIKEKDLRITPAIAGDKYDLGEEVFLTIVGPVFNDYQNLNDFSIIARLDDKSTSFLFTGDMEAVAEADLISEGANLQADILSMGHHGSNTSSHSAFYDIVNPDIGLISCGIDNSYGHPHKEIVQQLEDTNTDIYRTDLQGTILVETNGTNIVVTTER